jgi:dolichol-phosphate mannosyltransferase
MDGTRGTKTANARPAYIDGLSVVVPTLNEAAVIEEFVCTTARILEGLGLPTEIVVVDDGSPDGTADLVERLAPSLPVRVSVLRRAGVPSLSLSVIEGARAARYPSVAVLDADLSHDPADLPLVVAPLLSGDLDLTVGSRYARGGAIGSWSFRRQVMSALGTSLARVLTRVRDPLSGFFAARRALLDGTAGEIRPRGYKILLEVLARFPGIRVGEVPILFRDRRAGRSKFGVRQGLQFLAQVFTLLLLHGGRRTRARCVCDPVRGAGARFPFGAKRVSLEKVP